MFYISSIQFLLNNFIIIALICESMLLNGMHYSVFTVSFQLKCYKENTREVEVISVMECHSGLVLDHTFIIYYL